MPAFARIATADSIEASGITATTLDGNTDIVLDTVCTCPKSDGINDLPTPHDIDIDSDDEEHLSTCPVFLSKRLTSTFTQMKQEAFLKKRQLLQEQLEECRRKEAEQKRDPFKFVRMRPSRTCHLYSGSKFQGKQMSGSHSYEVVVDIKVTSIIFIFDHQLRLCPIINCKDN